MRLGQISSIPAVALRSFATQRLERCIGLRTSGTIWQRDLGYPYGLYRPSSWLVLNALFGQLEVAEEDVFADIGSGMGRAVFVAARRPFRRVIGIERSGDLTEIARENIARNTHRLACTDVELHTIDALDWAIPDDLTVVYLCCPFPDEILGHFLGKLSASLERQPRPLRLIYYFSTEHDRQLILSSGRVTQISFRVPWYLRSEFEEVSMFRLLPPDFDGRARVG
jgi:16S rRNA G966 N2-methylase RsmD